MTSFSVALMWILFERSLDSSMAPASETDLSMDSTPVPDTFARTQPLGGGSSVVAMAAANLDPIMSQDQ